MRTFPASERRFTEKPFFTPKDFERICGDALQQQRLYPSEPSPIRIDRFVEKHFKISPRYENLPVGLLGFTHFGPNGVEEIVVSKALDDEGTRVAERRLRTTLAHESGHGLLHAHLFALGSRSRSLFGDRVDDNEQKILCRSGGITGSDGSDGPRIDKLRYRWWEYQANQAIGALLLPNRLVATALVGSLMPHGAFGAPILPANRRKEAIQLLAHTFDVNLVVARLRLDTLFPVAAEGQLLL